jgi:hypothetical protein
MLPVSLKATDKYQLFQLRLMPANNVWPAISKIAEENIWKKMAEAIKKEDKLELSTDFDLSRDAVRGIPEGTRGIAIAGGPTAEALGSCLQTNGENIIKVVNSEWKITGSSIDWLKNQLQESINHMQVETVVLHILDENAYLGRGEDGSLIPPAKDNDDHLHIVGELTVIDAATTNMLLSQCLPLFHSLQGKNVVLISPPLRYVASPCCNNEAHLTNRGHVNYLVGVKAGLRTVVDTIRSFIKQHDLKNMRVLDPEQSLKSLQIDEIWGGHPYALTEVANKAIAAGVCTVDAAITKHLKMLAAKGKTRTRELWPSSLDRWSSRTEMTTTPDDILGPSQETSHVRNSARTNPYRGSSWSSGRAMRATDDRGIHHS